MILKDIHVGFDKGELSIMIFVHNPRKIAKEIFLLWKSNIGFVKMSEVIKTNYAVQIECRFIIEFFL